MKFFFLMVSVALPTFLIAGCDGIFTPKINLSSTDTKLSAYCTIIKSSLNQLLSDDKFPNDATLEQSTAPIFATNINNMIMGKEIVAKVKSDSLTDRNADCVYQTPNFGQYMKNRNINNMWFQPNHYMKRDS